MLFDFIKELISFRGISPGCGGAIDFLQNYLSGIRFHTEVIISGGIKNLFAVAKKHIKEVDICFAGHVDVVPPGDIKSWRFDPFCATVYKDVLYGRGVVDMKGAICCFISALQEILKKGNCNLNIGIIISSDEESTSRFGMVPVVEYLKEKGYKIKKCIVGEPTCTNQVGDIIKIGRRGSLSFKLEVFGKQGHVAYPGNAKNPIPWVIKRLQKLIYLKFDCGNSDFDPSHLEITSINVPNSFPNLIPQKIQIYFNIRFNNLHSIESLSRRINSIFENSEFKYEISKNNFPALPFIISNRSFAEAFAKSVENVTQISAKFSTSGGTSDARFLSNICDVVEFGLVNKTAHQVNEYSKLSDLTILQKVYKDFLQRCIDFS